ncbi:MAG: hypothetical protein J7L55_00170 [Desulfurococcales archaeon]|nr:hypothetical protein [Desulfurococcales archaeon]
MVESRYVLYGLIAGVIAGAVGSALFILCVGVDNLIKFTYDVTYEELVATGIPPKNASQIASEAVKGSSFLYFLTPIGPVINMLIFGSLMGALQDHLVRKGFTPVASAVVAGGLFVLLFNVLPLYALSALYGGVFVNVLLKYVNPWVIFIPSLTYVGLLIMFSAFKGPWARLRFGKPKYY